LSSIDEAGPDPSPAALGRVRVAQDQRPTAEGELDLLRQLRQHFHEDWRDARHRDALVDADRDRERFDAFVLILERVSDVVALRPSEHPGQLPSNHRRYGGRQQVALVCGRSDLGLNGCRERPLAQANGFVGAIGRRLVRHGVALSGGLLPERQRVVDVDFQGGAEWLERRRLGSRDDPRRHVRAACGRPDGGRQHGHDHANLIVHFVMILVRRPS